MKTMKRVLIAAIALSTMTAAAQTKGTLLAEGAKLKSQYKEAEALKKFKAVLKMDPDNVKALHNASWLTGQVGDRQKDDATKRIYFHKAEKMALKAIKLEKNNAEAHFSYAITLGQLSEVAESSKDKIKNAKLIKKESEAAIKFDSKHAGAYHLLGRWHYGVATLSWVEKTACNMLFGGVPEGATLEGSEKNLKMALKLKPGYILYYYDLAVTYEEMGQNAVAIAVLEKAIKLKLVTPDDPKRMNKCKTLLAELK